MVESLHNAIPCFPFQFEDDSKQAAEILCSLSLIDLSSLEDNDEGDSFLACSSCNCVLLSTKPADILGSLSPIHFSSSDNENDSFLTTPDIEDDSFFTSSPSSSSSSDCFLLQQLGEDEKNAANVLSSLSLFDLSFSNDEDDFFLTASSCSSSYCSACQLGEDSKKAADILNSLSPIDLSPFTTDDDSFLITTSSEQEDSFINEASSDCLLLRQWGEENKKAAAILNSLSLIDLSPSSNEDDSFFSTTSFSFFSDQQMSMSRNNLPPNLMTVISRPEFGNVTINHSAVKNPPLQVISTSKLSPRTETLPRRSMDCLPPPCSPLSNVVGDFGSCINTSSASAIRPSCLRMPSPRIGFFDLERSGNGFGIGYKESRTETWSQNCGKKGSDGAASLAVGSAPAAVSEKSTVDTVHLRSCGDGGLISPKWQFITALSAC